MKIWKTISTEEEYDEAVARLDELIDVTEDNPRLWNERTLLSFLVAEYDDEVIFPVPEATPLEVVRYVMKLRGITQGDLEEILGSKGQVSRILSGSRRLTIDKVAALAAFLNIPASSRIPKVEI